jgi:hypothetical protein
MPIEGVGHSLYAHLRERRAEVVIPGSAGVAGRADF